MKETKKQIKAQCINEVRHMFDERIKILENTANVAKHNYKVALGKCHSLQEEVDALKHENAHLKEKVEQQGEWIERMEEFCNMPDDIRQQSFKTYLENLRAETEKNIKLGTTLKFFDKVTRLLY